MDLVDRRLLNDLADNRVVLENEVWAVNWEMILQNVDIVVACNCYRVNDDDERDCLGYIYFDFAVAHAIAAASLTVAFDL